MTRTQMTLAALAALYLLALRGCYDIVPSGPGYAYRLNRFTGSVLFCVGASGCTAESEAPKQTRP